MPTQQDPTRRDFVKTAGTVTAATAASVVSAPAVQRARAAGDQVAYGLVGVGARGSYLLRHMIGMPNARCVALCDVYAPNLANGVKTIGGNPRAYKTHEELLADKEVEAVIVTTPLYAHFPVTRDALLAGKHVFCEKSLVFKPEEIHALRALSNERSKQVLQVGLQRRYSKFYQAARQMVAKGLIGNVTHVTAQWHRNTFANDPWSKPLPKDRTDREVNWRKYRDLSGGLAAELGSHQVDVADWMLGATPEFVVGVGGTNFIKDGRNIFDNIQLIYQYPKGQKCIYSSITTNRHLALFGGTRTEFGETILGTEGTIEITVGTDAEPAIALWYNEPKPAKATPASTAKKEETVAGASMASTGRGGRGFPILLDRDQMRGNESFLEKEMKYARRWLYSKGIMLPEEDRNPVDVQMESFFEICRTGKKPLADLEVGLADAAMVILSNLAMDEGRRVYFSEMDKMGRGENGASKRIT
ncbi:MAG TPA: Gfo/Idh/MocA family oxidoreductase [Bryobacteraceae bacterium]|nr:Gfo/Idh/MocA family oxidoreductase [Bryobacteraceae bacterium]